MQKTALLLAFLSTAALGEIPRVTIDQVRTSWIERCASAEMIKGITPDRSYGFCRCAWPVLAANLTLTEFEQMEGARDGNERAALPQGARIWPLTQRCRAL